jgi:alkanesulfonate monooxygenase SsuD/methylene tetrahydromethanopterin reductase-like flavin-dependent oxidoreductase (luciferase family)
VTRTINVGLAIGRDDASAKRQEEKLPSMFGGLTEFVKPGILIGTPARVVDRVGEYARAGAEWMMLALRAPFDWDGLGIFVRDVMPAFR